MKRLKHNFKKGMAFVLSLAMVAGLVPAMSGGANKVQAASGSGTEPSVSAYATKGQLMTAFTPASNGNATTIGKLVFGKNSSGDAQKWYILGKDSGVSGDNTIIFATSPIAEEQVFNSSIDNKTYNYEAGTGYGESAGSTTVNADHYGASDLRVALQRMLENESGNAVETYFTTAEQGLMNATTVTTKDTKIDNTYTTTDKLYALAADGYGSTTIKAGTNNQTVLAMSKYWSRGTWFWLRSPYGYRGCNVLHAYPGDSVDGDIVNGVYAVQPASNLNLSYVLFASAATAASSDIAESYTIALEAAMTLRLDGTGKDIGTVTYNTTTGDIKVVRGDTSQTVALVVQGKGTVNGEEKDWYYSKKIDTSETINVSAIEAESNTPESIDLSTCKIWLETTDSTENLTYAVEATETTIIIIHSVAITDIETPVSNTALDTEASCVTTGVSSTTTQITWTPSASTAGYNTSYTASITLTADTGYEFIDSTTATVSGNNATGVTKNADGTLTVTYAFPATKDKLKSITAPQAITVANGTAYSAMNLPATVNIVTEGNTVTSAQVTWNTTTPESGSYDPAVLTQQTVTLNGTVVCPDSIDDNGVALTTTITITISAAGIVGSPTANPTAGTYSENQSVELTSSTEGATIYYTTDGSEPTITGGAPSGTTQQYTAPIAVTGTEGQSVETTIKAIAVKNGMQDSSVETFTYTIHQIPVAKYTYATKTQLMDGTFAPITDGTAVNIGKLVFGKNSSGKAQEWYILGKDIGVTGDNTILFAASPIATDQVFENDSSNEKTFQANFGVYGNNPRYVFPNHYGASDLRVALKRMLEDENGNTVETYFTSAEQGLMNATTVTTKDTNNRVTYTTTDKLYALAGDGSGDSYKTIKAGTSDSTVLAMSSYWSSGSKFWLRSPGGMDAGCALWAGPGRYVSDDYVKIVHAVRPASNLNLSSVLFASSATAASSDTVSNTIASKTAMTLRFDGTGKNIGTVTYNTTTGDIKATKGSTEGDVALVVQGNDGTNDWYYSKQITGTEVVNVTDIVAESDTPSSIDLSTCKIWLEITDTDGLIYAAGATEVLSITSVEITGIDTPVSNTTLDTGALCATKGVSSTTPQITWTPSASTAGYNTSYTASITLTADTGYEFIDSTTATVSGNNATGVTKNADGTLTVTYAFPATKDKLKSITAPQAITVANGTAYSAMNLPATVNIVTEGNTVTSAQVTWNTTTPESGSYDPAVLTQQTVTLNGTVVCPDSIDANGVSLTTTITITISAADIVKAPTANPTAGNYSENQSVTLTSSTEGATIYYTTDGSEPTITGGVPGGTTAEYKAPIAVTGTEGQSITTTIKAIAVKNGMQDSSVETFTYTIQIPVPKYTVTVTNGSGTGQYTQGETVTITAGAAPSGQEFDKWVVESGSISLADATSATTTFTMPAGDVSVKAVWETTTYTVSFDANGGTGEMADVIKVVGDYKLPANGFTAPEGKHFKCWSVGGVEKAVGDTINVSDNTTVKAVWETTTYTVSFDANGGTGEMEVVTKVVGDYKLPANGFTAPEGKHFKCWSVGGVEKAVGDTINVSANTTVKAVWETTTYTVSFDANGGTGEMADVIKVVGDYKLPANGFTAPEGKYFKCWSVGGVEKAVGDTINVSANTTVKAIWENIPVKEYTITVTGGKATAGTSTEISKAAEGTTVTLTANAAPTGQEFDKWVVESGSISLADAASTTTTFTMPAGDVSVKATFKKKTVLDEAQVKAFVERLYNNILGRAGDEEGINSWVTLLADGTLNGATASYGFVNSDEFKNSGLTNEQKVEIFYATFLNRVADEAGKKMWADALNAGVDIEKIFEGFVMSTEFAGICDTYGISQGQMSDIPGMTDILNRYRNRNIFLASFIARCYEKALGRAADVPGVDAWCAQIIEGFMSPRNVAADGFFHSDEFIAKNTTNAEYVSILYQTFLGRELDEPGYELWVGLLDRNEWTRDEVLDGFANSDEFGSILASFGL